MTHCDYPQFPNGDYLRDEVIRWKKDVEKIVRDKPRNKSLYFYFNENDYIKDVIIDMSSLYLV